MVEAENTSPNALLFHLHSAQYFAFDLDDTLHNFRRASSTATKFVLTILHNKTGLPLGTLEEEYKRILTHGTASAFTDGKTSHHYRAERFQHLVQQFNIELAECEMHYMVDMYEKALMKSLQLKSGVVELFRVLKASGHKIAVITEGPQDAQERTVEALGIAPYIDFLATTNKLRVSKVDGLFERVLEHLDVAAKDVVMVGDSWERDIVPEMRVGIYCFHYDEKGGESGVEDGVGRIGNFGELQVLLERAHREAED